MLSEKEFENLLRLAGNPNSAEVAQQIAQANWKQLSRYDKCLTLVAVTRGKKEIQRLKDRKKTIYPFKKPL